MKKNILLLSVDDMIDIVRYRDAFGVELHTPAIDDLMARGVVFTNAFTPVPLCAPARAATLTGKSPFTTGVHHHHGATLEEVVPVEETLYGRAHEAGWYTAARGKTYHGQNFDDAVRRYLEPVLDQTEWTGGFMTSGNDLPGRIDGSPVPEDGTYDARTAEWAAEFLSAPPGAQPFFLSLGFYKPHLSWDVPERYYDLYDLERITVPELDLSFDDLPDFFKNILTSNGRAHERIVEADLWPSMIQAYLAAISFADAQIGKVVAAMDEADLWSSTTVALWSDHGYHLGDRDIWRKFTLWEEAASIPLIVVDPDLGAPGTEISVPVGLLDLWPTLSALTGLPEPVRADGLDLSGLMSGEMDDLPRSGVLTSAYGSLSLRTEDWRYVVYNSGEEELFEVGAGQIHGRDVSKDPEFGDVLDEMFEALREEARAIGVDLVAQGETADGSADDDVFVVLDGGVASGGDGDDTYYLATSGGIEETADGGQDTVYVSTNQRWRMPDNVEDVVLTHRVRGRIQGNAEANVVDGSPRANEIRGGRGADVLFGDEGDDRLYGNAGFDSLFGGLGGNRLFGGLGDDLITGGLGDEAFFGGRGADALRGEDGDDSIAGGRGDDRLRGGGGDDHLVGGRGRDWLAPGRGADVLEFHRGGGRDVVVRWQDGEDLIKFSSGASDFGSLAIEQKGRSVRILYGREGDTLIFRNTDAAEIDASDFLFE